MVLAKQWQQRKKKYDFVVIGSGYGGAIMAARLSHPQLQPRQSVCILERGREWPVGSFPDEALKTATAVRNPLLNPLGLYEMLPFPDISVLQGSGLGGTSLINANIAITPPEEVFTQSAWPRNIKLAELTSYLTTVKQMLAVSPHPRAMELLKVQSLNRRAREMGNQATPLDLAVNFQVDGKNAYGMEQKPCIDCADCVTGCNVGAKNTLYMNYLPLAAQNGTDIFTQTQVDWLEKLSEGGWKIHGRRYNDLGLPEKFELLAGNLILSAGSLGSTEILLRSELHGLTLSTRVGTGFTGNGDFFDLAYNSDYQTNVLGFGNDASSSWRANGPGPTIVSAIRYDPHLPFNKRILVEDAAFPKAYVSAAMLAFGALGGEDTDKGDELQEEIRRSKDNPFAPYRKHNALNHTMLYLVMGHDDAQGTIRLNTSFLDPNGRIEIDWDNAGRQLLFTRMNEELRRHARSLGAHFIANPLWSFFCTRPLITVHPLGGCPLGDDYTQGAVDEFGRVFAADGTHHQGLYVVDGAIIPTPVGVNPFLTISALAERIADRLTKNIMGQPYPTPPATVPVSGIDPLAVVKYKEAELERLFNRVETKNIALLVNNDQESIDLNKELIRNHRVWKGCLPHNHILSIFSSPFSLGFQSKFKQTENGYVGTTRNVDQSIKLSHTIEEITLDKSMGTLARGKYLLLRYQQAPWTTYYNVFKLVNEDLLIGRVYLGEFPHGVRLFTFAMTRAYAFTDMTLSNHEKLYDQAAMVSKNQLAGKWQMYAINNGNNPGKMANLEFQLATDGRLSTRYQFMGLLEGTGEAVFGQKHFSQSDFSPFLSEIHYLSDNLLLGKYSTTVPAERLALFRPLGLFQPTSSTDAPTTHTFSYLLRRSSEDDITSQAFLTPLADMRLPNGVGLRFDEELVGHYLANFSPPQGRVGDLSIAAKIDAQASAATACSFQARIRIKDLNEFFASSDHEALLRGSIKFADFAGQGAKSFEINKEKSRFNYLIINPATQEAEMRYEIYFLDESGKEYLFQGRKYMQRDKPLGLATIGEILADYTTLYCRLREVATGRELGSGVVKFRTFEDINAISSLTAFLTSFHVLGTDNPILQAQAQLSFLAFTNKFIFTEYLV